MGFIGECRETLTENFMKFNAAPYTEHYAEAQTVTEQFTFFFSEI